MTQQDRPPRSQAPPEIAQDRAVDILERITDGFFALDRQGRFVFVNRRAEEILGRKRCDLLTRSIWELFPAAAETQLFERYRRALAEQQMVHFVETLPTMDRCFDVRLYPSEQGVSVYFRDVTEEQRTEAALRESEERFRLMVEGSEMVFFYRHDEEGHFTYLSPSVRRVLGYGPAELLGSRYGRLMYGDPTDEIVDATTRRTLSEGVAPQPYVACVRHRTGAPVWLELVEGPVERDGRVVAVQGFARDVTHRRRLEQERERLLAEERAARLEAEDEARRREEVVGVVSHDLRNPLHAIALNAEYLLEVALPEPERARRLRRILTAAQRMGRLIQGLLDTQRLGAGQELSIEPQRLDPLAVVREACALFEAQAEARRVRLLLEVPSGTPAVHADEGRLLQILWNLIGNAIRFTPPGESVLVRAEGAGRWVRFSVRDSGPGIPEANLSRLFDPYWQDKRTARLGAGLGLPISRALVEAHGGEIWVESESGAGSLFVFTIPRVPDAGSSG